MRSLRTSDGEAGQLDLFVGAGSDIAARDAQDLMAWPFFSLAKSKRVKPIDFRMSKLLAKTIDALANGCFHHPVALRGPSYLFIIPL